MHLMKNPFRKPKKDYIANYNSALGLQKYFILAALYLQLNYDFIVNNSSVHIKKHAYLLLKEIQIKK